MQVNPIRITSRARSAATIDGLNDSCSAAASMTLNNEISQFAFAARRTQPAQRQIRAVRLGDLGRPPLPRLVQLAHLGGAVDLAESEPGAGQQLGPP